MGSFGYLKFHSFRLPLVPLFFSLSSLRPFCRLPYLPSLFFVAYLSFLSDPCGASIGAKGQTRAGEQDRLHREEEVGPPPARRAGWALPRVDDAISLGRGRRNSCLARHLVPSACVNGDAGDAGDVLCVQWRGRVYGELMLHPGRRLRKRRIRRIKPGEEKNKTRQGKKKSYQGRRTHHHLLPGKKREKQRELHLRLT